MPRQFDHVFFQAKKYCHVGLFSFSAPFRRLFSFSTPFRRLFSFSTPFRRWGLQIFLICLSLMLYYTVAKLKNCRVPSSGTLLSFIDFCLYQVFYRFHTSAVTVNLYVYAHLHISFVSSCNSPSWYSLLAGTSVIIFTPNKTPSLRKTPFLGTPLYTCYYSSNSTTYVTHIETPLQGYQITYTYNHTFIYRYRYIYWNCPPPGLFL